MDTEKNTLTVPMAIIVAGIIIGGAIFFSQGRPSSDVSEKLNNDGANEIENEINLRAVSDADHILGNPSAKIIAVEFSDLECPFCKSFHKTMQALMDEYAKAGNLSWVYRHFPLDIHPKAPKEAEASECANELGGNQKFWAYVNRLFEITPSNNQLDLSKLPEIATSIGIDRKLFENCLSSGKYGSKVQADYDDGILAGVSGTPNTIFVLSTPVTASAEKRLSEINQSILLRLPPGSPDVIIIDRGRLKISLGGAFPLPLMREIIELLLP